MSDSIYDVLTPYFESTHPDSRPDLAQHAAASYLNRITTLDLTDLSPSSTEPASILQSLHSNLRSLQALSRRAHKSIITAAESLAPLSAQLPTLVKQADELSDALPHVERKAAAFAEKYRKSNEAANDVLQERKNALLLARNVERVSSILDLPTLLSSTISTGQQPGTGSNTSTIATSVSGVASSVNYGSALDLHAHVKRLGTLYPASPVVSSIIAQSDVEMRLLTTNLITALRSPNIKLASAMRTIGWLRRVAPELDDHMRRENKSVTRSSRPTHPLGGGDGAFGALFLLCRLASLDSMLGALAPLRDLADQESLQRAAATQQKVDAKTKQIQEPPSRSTGSGGQQTERYLKRYIEIFREQSFAIVSMYKSIFPGALPAPGSHELQSTKETTAQSNDNVKKILLPLPSPLATFPAHLVDRLHETLKSYLPNITDSAARESLLTQVLYCAGSMGRLGGDFSMMLALLEEDLFSDAEQEREQEQDQSVLQDDEWVRVMKKHRVQASRLELLASGVGAAKTAPKEASPG